MQSIKCLPWSGYYPVQHMFYMSVATIRSVNRIYVWWLFVKAMSWCATRIHVPLQEFTESHWYCSDNSEDKRFMHPSGAKGSTLVSSLRTTILVSPWLLFTSTVKERMAAEEEEPRRYIYASISSNLIRCLSRGSCNKYIKNLIR